MGAFKGVLEAVAGSNYLTIATAEGAAVPGPAPRHSIVIQVRHAPVLSSCGLQLSVYERETDRQTDRDKDLVLGF